MSYNTVGPVGTTGNQEGPNGIGYTTAVTQIDGYSSASYIYGIKLYWGGTSQMYGQTNSLSPVTLNCSGDAVMEIKYHIDATSVLRGIKFKTVSTATLTIGYLDDDRITAFSNSDNVFTNLTTFKGTISSVVTIWGATFYYTGTALQSARHPLCVAELGLPALAVLAHTVVVAKSLMNVGKLRRTLAIGAPSCDPPLTTSPSDAQLWYRTFRAQENCKEMFLVYLPSILIASTLGYHVFGKWAPRAVGTLAMTSAFFRHRYLNAYIEDADKRGKPFYFASMAMKPVFFLAVVSSGYLVGKELYHTVMGHVSKAPEEEEDD